MPCGAARVTRRTAYDKGAAGGLDAGRLTAAQMQDIAAEVGYSETAFVSGPVHPGGLGSAVGGHLVPIRYFAPEGEVDFCGHATIATAVALCESLGEGSWTLGTKVGPVAITGRHDGARTVGTLRSPAVGCLPLEPHLLGRLLDALQWSERDLRPDLPPAIGFGGNRHPVLVARDLARLESLSYDFPRLQRLSREQGWVTVHLVVPTGPGRWRARDPFPWGGVVEDPATGAAAAAFAGYLRQHARARTGDTFVITQGVEMGRPSTIEVELLEDVALVSGPATRIRPDGED
ncbi:PhzF family phenazine biosynthesis isomerase [Terrabacter lapilli]|uniref:PhzF family phenazine biosynthesis isomerase n=1 Tax=Terrabacter lapilli TaxID=436231 RepID=A0ABP5DS58_9MICO